MAPLQLIKNSSVIESPFIIKCGCFANDLVRPAHFMIDFWLVSGLFLSVVHILKN